MQTASYRLPAPWGSLRFTCIDGEFDSLIPELEVVEGPDRAPEEICRWMDIAGSMLEHPHVLSAADRRHLFSLRRMRGLSDFARAVLREVSFLEPGEILSYAQIAERIGEPSAARSVGRALAANPFPILIACHRVAPARAISSMSVLKPQTLMPEAYLGDKAKKGIGAWLRIRDLADLP